jgi:hypothetical protein
MAKPEFEGRSIDRVWAEVVSYINVQNRGLQIL